MNKQLKYLASAFVTTIALMIASVISANAQASSTTAEVRGQVTDSTNAVIPGATVTLTDVSKGTVRTSTTDAEGNYVFLALLPGLTI